MGLLKTVLVVVALVAFVRHPALTLVVLALGGWLWLANRQRAVRHGTVVDERGGQITTEQLRAENCVHEAGHYVIAKRRGAGGVSAYVKAIGHGGTNPGYPKTKLDHAVITAAGSEAANTFYHGKDKGITCGDERLLRSLCRDMKMPVCEVRVLARADVQKHAAEIRRVAKKLDRTGRA